MFTRILVVNDALPDAAPLFHAAGRLVQTEGTSLMGLATLATADEHAWATWAAHPVQVVQVPTLDAPTVLAFVAHLGIDLIVLGSGCGAGHEHPQTPALTEGVTLGTTLPVLLLREGMGIRVPSADRPFCTLIPVDGSAVAEGILATAARVTTAFAGESGGMIHLVQVVHGAFGALPAHRETMLPPDAQVRWYLDQLAQRLRAQVPPRVTISSHIEPASDVSEALLRELGTIPRLDGAPVQPWDLLAMGVLGPTGHEPHDQASVVNRVLHATTLPMVVHCQRTHPELVVPHASMIKEAI